jgi:hypothetical protein
MRSRRSVTTSKLGILVFGRAKGAAGMKSAIIAF